ncbi:MAG: hypothetical protein LLF98_02005 [Clostridium sp.]|uniref:hypothetical protein n=1 Tax=Clostridium sp. TaxID=1506 RepID=UPI0025BDB777|nr:hypothetical protein [Clostridium sp.]MCE5220055.1 hypothetical protein [Clostridium sp.]
MAIQKTTYYNLDKPDKGTLNWHINNNNNFDVIDTELHNQDERIDNLVTGVTVDSEVIDARRSAQRNATYSTLDARLEDIELKGLRKDVADTKTGDLTMNNDSGIIFGGKVKFSFNEALGTVDITTV